MGDLADQIIDGAACAFCLMPFVKDHGYPVACSSCWEPKCGYQKAVFKTIDGGPEKINYTESKQAAFGGIRRYVKKNLKFTDITAVVNEYMPGAELSLKQKCLEIQKDFLAFVKFIKDKKSGNHYE